MSSTYHTRMGDGRRIEMTKEELKKDIEAGASEAAKRNNFVQHTLYEVIRGE